MQSVNFSGPPGIEIRKCNHGHGVFANKRFPAGGAIGIIVGGKTVKEASAASVYALKIPHRKLWWDEMDASRPEWDSYLDHSSKANAKILFTSFNPKKPKARLIAVRKIEKGDEITINYQEYGDRLYKRRNRRKTVSR